MKRNRLGRCAIEVSEIGFGGEYLEGKPYSTVRETIDRAMDAGVNAMDIFMSEPNVRSNIGRALRGRRDKMVIQGHFRSIWENGQYGRTLDTGKTKLFFEDLMRRLETDYIDIGMLHMIDNEKDYDAVFRGGIYQYALELKDKGVIRAIGMSSHNPEMALRAVLEDKIDVLMFSLNAAYDLFDEEDVEGPPELTNDLFERLKTEGVTSSRSRLYQSCEAKGIGITVMKPLAAGILLDEKRSPFGAAMTPAQCIHYALSRPGVKSVMVGMQTMDEVEQTLLYEELDAKERDYSFILRQKPQFSMEGQCVYCNHCLPCPSRIDVARVNQYLDIAKAEGGISPTIREHYGSLEAAGGDCTACGACEVRCPFRVKVMDKMREAAEMFGR